MFRLTYVYHDCFVLDCEECVVVFDYWKDILAGSQNTPPFLDSIPQKKPVYVLVSHFHKDHFNKVVFEWIKDFPNIRYVISPDVRRQIRYMLEPDSHYAGKKIPAANVTILRKMEKYSDETIEIQAFGSTDIGNSYALTLKKCGLKVFHAGDLNCWAWRDESTPEEVRAAENAFRSELKPIAAGFPEFDIAMFPVDSRIGSGYAQGASEFVRTVRVKRFFPMHFTLGDSPEECLKRRLDALDFDLYATRYGEYIALTSPYDAYFSAE